VQIDARLAPRAAAAAALHSEDASPNIEQTSNLSIRLMPSCQEQPFV
jgi:hypothetical protein